MASSSASTALVGLELDRSRLRGCVMPSASARPSAKSARRSSSSNLANASCGAAAVHRSRAPWRGSPRFRTAPRSHSAGRGLRAACPGAWRCRLRSRAAPARSGPISARRPSAMSAAFCRSTSAALGQVLAVLASAPARPWRSSRPAARRAGSTARRISLMSAIERAAVARTSTRVSSISRMIMRIIRAGSSARSSSSVMFAAKMSRARLNTGPLSQAATGRKPRGREPRALPRSAAACAPEPGLRGSRVQALMATCRLGLA